MKEREAASVQTQGRVCSLAQESVLLAPTKLPSEKPREGGL